MKGLVNDGVPVDGVGLQMHVALGVMPKPRHVRRAVRRFASLGLQVHITELDVRIRKPISREDLERQAEAYADMMRAACRYDACTGVFLWGLDDGHSWVPHFFKENDSALLFDREYQPKPAYYAVADVLRKGK